MHAYCVDMSFVCTFIYFMERMRWNSINTSFQSIIERFSLKIESKQRKANMLDDMVLISRKQPLLLLHARLHQRFKETERKAIIVPRRHMVTCSVAYEMCTILSNLVLFGVRFIGNEYEYFCLSIWLQFTSTSACLSSVWIQCSILCFLSRCVTLIATMTVLALLSQRLLVSVNG